MSSGTAAEGLGWAHQKARKAALEALDEGEECELCGRPMWRSQQLDLDHEIARALGGADGPTRLTHSSCNRSAGAAMGNRLRGRRRPARPARRTSRDW